MTRDRAAEARVRFDRPELAPLWRALRDRMERSDRPVSRVRVGPLTLAQRTALADLLGLSRLPGETFVVAVERLDQVLSESPAGLDSRGVVEAIGGPLVDRAAARRAAGTARTVVVAGYAPDRAGRARSRAVGRLRPGQRSR